MLNLEVARFMQLSSWRDAETWLAIQDPPRVVLTEAQKKQAAADFLAMTPKQVFRNKMYELYGDVFLDRAMKWGGYSALDFCDLPNDMPYQGLEPVITGSYFFHA
jgi:hypothetical protein